MDEVAIECIEESHLKEKIKYFDCTTEERTEEEENINNFLKKKALKEAYSKNSSTFLVVSGNERIIGFYTVDISSFEIDYISDRNEKYSYSINVKYLAVDNKYQQKGYGENILIHIMSTYREIAKNIGIRYLTVRTHSRTDWYVKRGFKKHNSQYFDVLVYDLKEGD